MVKVKEEIETTETSRATAEQIKTWKNQHGDVYELNVEGCFGYIRKPGRKELAHASTVGKNNPLKFNETILTNCWLGGDDRIKTNDEYFLGACQVIGEIITLKDAEIKKL